MKLSPLPIDELLPKVVETLGLSSTLVLRAPTGAGKTTRIPPALLDAGIAGDKLIVMLEPRRLAAQTAAARMAEERGTALGEAIGYQVRFERRASRATRILVVTEGIFLRMLSDDPYLEQVQAVIFDEFHERSLNADLALALVRKVQAEVRADLKIVVMSATLNVEQIAAFLGNCPVLESAGRMFPVDLEYLPFETKTSVAELAARGVSTALDRTAGDLLVFLPGVGEIRRAAEQLQSLAQSHPFQLCELYGEMPLDRQQAVLKPGTLRKVVLATNVAETSLTVPGVTGVVDTGLSRVMRLDNGLGLNRLELGRISRASAEQRAGRAGRTAPGYCFRLWSEREQRELNEQETPEVLRVDLAGPVLELLSWGERDVHGFGWFETPPAAAIDRALRLLNLLGAVDEGRVTPLGQRMVRLPLHPRLARLLCEGERLGHARFAALAAAMLSERDPFQRGRGATGPRRSDSDVLDRLHALQAFEDQGTRHGAVGSLEQGAARQVLRARDQFLRLLGRKDDRSGDTSSAEQAILRALLAAFPDRVARRRDAGSRRAVLLGGRGVQLDDASGVLETELFVCVQLEDIGRADSLVRQASAIQRDWLNSQQLQVRVDVEFDTARERVVAVRRTRYEDLVLDETPASIPPSSDVAGVLAAAAAAQLDRAVVLNDEAAMFLERWRCLAAWMPELNLPPLAADPRRELVPFLCHGCQSFEDLRKAPALAILRNMLTHQQLSALERDAPARLKVPSGSEITLTYETGQPPVLAVRIQELFGMKQTPRVAGNRVPVLLHLLAPNMRPQQVTGDLESFWNNTYPIVRKELRARYPKHSWPEDPWNALPQKRPSRKK